MIRRPPTSPLFPTTPLSRSTRPPPYPWDRVPERPPCRAALVCPARPAARFAAAEFDWPRTRLLRAAHPAAGLRSEEHTSELQSRQYLVCRLLLEKKKKI